MTDNYTNVILEEIRDQNKAVLEAVGIMRQEMTTLAKQADLVDLRQDVQVIKAAVIDTSNELRKLDQRVTRLESA